MTINTVKQKIEMTHKKVYIQTKCTFRHIGIPTQLMRQMWKCKVTMNGRKVNNTQCQNADGAADNLKKNERKNYKAEGEIENEKVNTVTHIHNHSHRGTNQEKNETGYSK